MSAPVGSLVATVPEVLADLSGAVIGQVRRELPGSDLVRQIWKSVRDVHGVSEEAMINIVPERQRDREFRAGEQDTEEQAASGQSVAEVLPAHDTETSSSSKPQHRLGKLVNRVCLRTTSIRWTSSPIRRPSEARATHNERKSRVAMAR